MYLFTLLNSNPPIAWAILAVTLLVFVAAGGWFIWAMRNWSWPEGNRFEASFKGFKATLIISDAAIQELGLSELGAYEVAQKSAKAAWAANKAWEENPLDPNHSVKKRFSHTVVAIRTDAEFDGKNAEVSQHWAAVLGKVKKRVGGSYLPMTVTRTKYYDLILSTGEPVIHELCHQAVWDAPADGVKLYDYRHQDSRLWVSAGDNSMQGRARLHFLNN